MRSTKQTKAATKLNISHLTELRLSKSLISVGQRIVIKKIKRKFTRQAMCCGNLGIRQVENSSLLNWTGRAVYCAQIKPQSQRADGQTMSDMELPEIELVITLSKPLRLLSVSSFQLSCSGCSMIPTFLPPHIRSSCSTLKSQLG